MSEPGTFFLAQIKIDLPAMDLNELVALFTILSIVLPALATLIVWALGKWFVPRKQWWAAHKNLEEQATRDRAHSNKCFAEHLGMIGDLKTAGSVAQSQLTASISALNQNLQKNEEATKENTETVQEFSRKLAVLEDRTNRQSP